MKEIKCLYCIYLLKGELIQYEYHSSESQWIEHTSDVKEIKCLRHMKL